MAEDWEDPRRAGPWLDEQRQVVVSYLEAEGILISAASLSATWFVAPIVSLWYAETQLSDPQSVWVIVGDLPSDYVPGAWARSGREAVRVISQRWLQQSDLMIAGRADSNVSIGTPAQWSQLGPLLRARAVLLLDVADDNDYWPGTTPN